MEHLYYFCSHNFIPKVMKRNYKKKIAWGFLLLLLIAGGIICKKRWSIWFHNKPEPAYVLSNLPQRIILTFGNDGELSRSVSWVCGGRSRQAKLEYTEVGSGDTLSVDGFSKFFKTGGGFCYANYARFKELHYGRKYSYRVWNDNRASDWYSFRTQPDTTAGFSFVFMGDVQDKNGNEARKLMERVRHRFANPDFYAFAGDFIERPMNCYWEEAYRSVDSIAPHFPLLVSPGNHEYNKGVVRRLEERFAYAFPYLLRSRYKDNHVYAIDYKDATFITLDSNRDPWFQFSQREWLEKVLKASRKKWKIVMLHHPLYSIKGALNNLTIRWLYKDLLDEYDVDLVLQGHEHNYARMTSKEDSRTETPLYLVSHASPKNYDLYFNDQYDRFGTGHRFYQYIEVKEDTLSVRAFLDNDSLYDNLQIIKNDSGTQIIDRAAHIPEVLEMPGATGEKADKFRKEAARWKERASI